MRGAVGFFVKFAVSQTGPTISRVSGCTMEVLLAALVWDAWLSGPIMWARLWGNPLAAVGLFIPGTTATGSAPANAACAEPSHSDNKA